MTNFHFPLPEMYKVQIELISVTQIDGGQVLQRLVLFKEKCRHYKEIDQVHKTSGSPENSQR